ncbi:MAG: hypothetical protein HY347_07850 [candidate division NC10 bacterium]|nr:hypothetical protein [candidate division NC10 bacterium]
MPPSPGFYAVEKSQVQRRIVARPKETMSVISFLRALMHGGRLPKEALVTGLDRMLYHVYRLHGEGAAGREAVQQVVNALSRSLYNPQARNRLLTESPVVLFTLEYIEHGERWKAGVRIRPRNEPLELFWLEQFLPRCEVTEMGGESVCYSQFRRRREAWGGNRHVG